MPSTVHPVKDASVGRNIHLNDDNRNTFSHPGWGRDDRTWEMIAAQYSRILIAWAMRCPATAIAETSAKDIADQVLARAWLALSAKDFPPFPNPAAFLSYLRMCVTHTAIDAVRASAVQAGTVQILMASTTTDPELALLDQLDRMALWGLVNSLVGTEQERVILIERYVLDLPPRRILARHPTLFADVTAIYTLVRNLCCRLRHHHGLRQLWDEHIVV
jgi:DNA-directed RNA polymerase specialized sigma24 family protein